MRQTHLPDVGITFTCQARTLSQHFLTNLPQNITIYSTKARSMNRPTSPSHPQPFRFLDLPQELRFMVYEHLLTRSSHKLLVPYLQRSTCTAKVLTYAVSAPIHKTSKFVSVEALPVLREALLNAVASSSSAQVILDTYKGVHWFNDLTSLCTFVCNLAYMLTMLNGHFTFSEFVRQIDSASYFEEAPHCQARFRDIWNNVPIPKYKSVEMVMAGSEVSVLDVMFLTNMMHANLTRNFKCARPSAVVLVAPDTDAANDLEPPEPNPFYGGVVETKIWEEEWM